jgi:hypothetical protein
MHEQNELTMCALIIDDTNPAVWFAQLNRIRQRFNLDYKLSTYDDADVLQRIM